MAGKRGRSGPPGNQKGFRHGLAGTPQRRAYVVLDSQEQGGGAEQISTAMRVLAADSVQAAYCPFSS